jgi:hypothetical protein
LKYIGSAKLDSKCFRLESPRNLRNPTTPKIEICECGWCRLAPCRPFHVPACGRSLDAPPHRPTVKHGNKLQNSHTLV